VAGDWSPYKQKSFSAQIKVLLKRSPDYSFWPPWHQLPGVSRKQFLDTLASRSFPEAIPRYISFTELPEKKFIDTSFPELPETIPRYTSFPELPGSNSSIH
jgi:hypothetical protein